MPDENACASCMEPLHATHLAVTVSYFALCSVRALHAYPHGAALPTWWCLREGPSTLQRCRWPWVHFATPWGACGMAYPSGSAYAQLRAAGGGCEAFGRSGLGSYRAGIAAASCHPLCKQPQALHHNFCTHAALMHAGVGKNAERTFTAA